MSEATGPILQNAADMEVELSAEDLLALSNSQSATPAAAQTPAPSMPRVSVRTREMSAAKRPTRRNLAGAPVALSLVGALVLVSAGYGLIAWHKATPSFASTFEQKTTSYALLSEASQAEPEPVRLTNPFDAGEVFEFTPGTTQDAAREAVAEILMKRAIARQGS
ncbi:MAG TPA: hypothetical protein VIU34_35900 [Steroidobacter sp.]